MSSGKNAFLGGEISGSRNAVHFERSIHKVKDHFFLWQSLNKPRHHWVFGRQTHECSAIESVLTGGEDFNGIFPTHHWEPYGSTMAFPDPVLLHTHDPVRPAGKLFAVFKHVIGIIGNFEEPAVHFLDADFKFRVPPTATVFNLLVGQNRLAFFTPVHMGFFAISKPLFIHFDKNQLFPSIILGVAGGQFAIPIVAEPHSFQLGFHGVDIFIGPSGRMGIVFNGGVFRRHTECVPPHGMKHIFSAHLLVSGHHITDGVISHMTDMNFSGWIGEHLQKIIFFSFRVFFRFKNALFFPMGLPPGFQFQRIVFHVAFSYAFRFFRIIRMMFCFIWVHVTCFTVQTVKDIIQDAINIPAGIFTTESFADFNGFIKRDFGGNVLQKHHLIGCQPENDPVQPGHSFQSPVFG